MCVCIYIYSILYYIIYIHIYINTNHGWFQIIQTHLTPDHPVGSGRGAASRSSHYSPHCMPRLGHPRTS
jgi:hypothetical protein